MGCIGNYEILKKTEEFSLVYNDSIKWHFEGAVVFYKSGLKKNVGFTASKKVGNSVKRNLARRRLKAIFREIEHQLKSGSYIFVAKRKIDEMDYKSLKKGLLWSFKRLNCLEK